MSAIEHFGGRAVLDRRVCSIEHFLLAFLSLMKDIYVLVLFGENIYKKSPKK